MIPSPWSEGTRTKNSVSFKIIVIQSLYMSTLDLAIMQYKNENYKSGEVKALNHNLFILVQYKSVL